jgi:hypothetical protein
MRITFKSPLSASQTNEKSSFTLTAKFYDDSSDPWTLSAPTTVSYRVDDLFTGFIMRDWTSLTTGTSVAIPLASADNAIVSDVHPMEKRQVTVKANDGLATQYQATFVYWVKNLVGQI